MRLTGGLRIPKDTEIRADAQFSTLDFRTAEDGILFIWFDTPEKRAALLKAAQALAALDGCKCGCGRLS